MWTSGLDEEEVQVVPHCLVLWSCELLLVVGKIMNEQLGGTNVSIPTLVGMALGLVGRFVK